MLQKRTIKDFMVQVMIIWGIANMSICLFCSIFGEKARENSSFFALGREGIPIPTLIQFFFFAIVVTGIQWLFFTDLVFRKMSLTMRLIAMLICIPVAGRIFAIAFRWFPVREPKAWISFLICYGVCAVLSVFVSAKSEKEDNKRLQDALERVKADE